MKWRKAVRKIWDLPYRTHCAMLPIIADAFPIEISLECKFVKGNYYFQRDSEAVFGINIVIWGFTICLLFRDPKIKFWKKNV